MNCLYGKVFCKEIWSYVTLMERVKVGDCQQVFNRSTILRAENFIRDIPVSLMHYFFIQELTLRFGDTAI